MNKRWVPALALLLAAACSRGHDRSLKLCAALSPDDTVLSFRSKARALGLEVHDWDWDRVTSLQSTGFHHWGCEARLTPGGAVASVHLWSLE